MKKTKTMERAIPLTIEEARSKSKDIRLKKCRYCLNEKDSKRFYKSFDFLDSDGKLSLCIDCCSYLFNYFYQMHGRIDIAIYETCKCTNVRYDSRAYSSLMKALEKNGIQATINAIKGEEASDEESQIDKIAVDTKTSLFGKYLTTLRGFYTNKEDADLTFDVYKNDRPEGYEDKTTDKPVTEVIEQAYNKKMSALEKKWGTGYEDDDYVFLENEYNGWAKTKDTDEKGVDTLIRELCLQQLTMRKARESGEGLRKSDYETLTLLMDKCSLTPDRLKESTSGKSAAAFGSWLKDVETMSPAEWIENKKLFKDIEGIDEYVKRTYDRAVRNYIGMSRDFRVVTDKMDKEAEEFKPEDISGVYLDSDGDDDGTERNEL